MPLPIQIKKSELKKKSNAPPSKYGDHFLYGIISPNARSWLRTGIAKSTPPVIMDDTMIEIKNRHKYISSYFCVTMYPSVGFNNFARFQVSFSFSFHYFSKLDGIPDLMVKFDRQGLKELLSVGENVRLTFFGRWGRVPFRGSDTIRVLLTGETGFQRKGLPEGPARRKPQKQGRDRAQERGRKNG